MRDEHDAASEPIGDLRGPADDAHVSDGAKGTDPKRVAMWRYVIPNAITVASLLIGLSALTQAIEGRFEDAAWLIVLCVLLDKLDGTAARLLKATSRFGMQMDSLADFVVFGVVPGFTVLQFVSHSDAANFSMWNSGIGLWVLRGIVGGYVACTGLRLAKFNVMSDAEGDGAPKVFYGMPTTFAGGVLGLLMLIGLGHDWPRLLWMLPIIALIFSALMVSNAPLPKLAKRGSRVRQGFEGALLLFAYVCGFFRILPEYLFIVTAVYGIVGFAWGFLHRQELSPRRKLQPG